MGELVFGKQSGDGDDVENRAALERDPLAIEKNRARSGLDALPEASAMFSGIDIAARSS